MQTDKKRSEIRKSDFGKKKAVKSGRQISGIKITTGARAGMGIEFY